MIEINEQFTVAAPSAQVYAVLSDPNAVVECVSGAELGEQHEDGTYSGRMTVKFSALRVSFAGRVGLELEDEAHRGTVRASGRDGQGGTKFQATAEFQVAAGDGGTTSLVTANGEVVLSGKLASVIENAATAVVRRMTAEFVEALSVRCASDSAQLGPAEVATPASVPSPNGSVPVVGRPEPAAGVLLLHGFGGSPSGVRPWGEALADAGLTVNIPRLPGHGTRWKDLNRTTWADWYAAADRAFAELRTQHEQVFVMGLSLGATLALRLAQLRPGEIAGVVAVNPAVSAPLGTPRPLALMRYLRRSSASNLGDIKRPGASDVGYQRTPLRAAQSLATLGTVVVDALSTITQPVLLATSSVNHVVPPGDAAAVWDGLPTSQRRRVVFANSYHVVPLDNDAPELIAESIEFVRSRALAGQS